MSFPADFYSFLVNKVRPKTKSIFVQCSKFYSLDTESADWGHGSGPACDDFKGMSAITRAKREAIRQCQILYRNKEMLNCSYASVATSAGQLICIANVTVE